MRPRRSSTASSNANRSSPTRSCRRLTRPGRGTCGDRMTHPPERDWMIVAPWWQWTDPASVPPNTPVVPSPLAGRLSRPILQKYDSPNLVNDFLENPQRCLTFVDDDLVHSVQAQAGPHESKTH